LLGRFVTFNRRKTLSFCGNKPVRIESFWEKRLLCKKKWGWCLTAVGACDKPLLHDP
jgi:hypothetical protein